MVNIKIELLLLALATFVMVCFLSSHRAGAELDELDNDYKALTRAICCGDIIKLYRQCKKYVKKDGEEDDDPSEECCGEVQKADLACICQYIPPVVEMFIDMERLANVAGKCQRPLPTGTKCGSYTISGPAIPPAPSPEYQEAWSFQPMVKVHPAPQHKHQEDMAKVHPEPPPPHKHQEDMSFQPMVRVHPAPEPPPPPPHKHQEDMSFQPMVRVHPAPEPPPPPPPHNI